MPARTARAPMMGALVVGLATLTLGWLVVDRAPEAAGGAPSGSRYVEGVLGAAERVNPLLARTGADEDLAALVFSGLARLDAAGLPQPDLAEYWDVTPDGRTYTFHLRDDVYWHDGERFGASDVAATFAHVQAEDFAGAAGLAARWNLVQLFVIDSYTVVMHLPEANAGFLASATLGILPAHLVGGLDGAALEASDFNSAPVGTGPYRLTALDGDGATLERHPTYHLGPPAIARIDLRFHDSAAEQLEALRDGAVDGALLPEQAGIALGAADLERRGLVTRSLLRNAYTLLYLNHLAAPLDDVALRRALLASLDRGALAVAAGAAGERGEGVLVPGTWAHGGELPTASPVVLERLWEATGWPLDNAGVRRRGDEALTLALVTNPHPVRVALAGAIAEQLRAHGVNVLIEVVAEPQVVRGYLEPRTYQLAIFGWEADSDPDPYAGWHSSQVAGGANVSGHRDPASDALLEAARATLDVEERRALYANFERRLVEQGAVGVLYYPIRHYVQPANLERPQPGPLFSAAGRFSDVHLWRIAR